MKREELRKIYSSVQIFTYLGMYSLMSSRKLDYAPASLLQTEAATKRGLALDGSDM